MLTLRKFPNPWTSMFSFSSDCDGMRPALFEDGHRFLNTEQTQDGYGAGCGLDVGDSFFFKGGTGSGPCVFDDSRQFPSEDNYAEYQVTHTTLPTQDLVSNRVDGRLVFSAWQQKIAHYLGCGWMDCLHGGDGNLAHPESPSADTTRWRRSDGEHYMDWLASLGLKVTTQANHASTATSFGGTDPATPQPTHDISGLCHYGGDVPSSPYYWADYALQSGMRYLQSYSRVNIGQGVGTGRTGYNVGVPKLLEPITLRGFSAGAGKAWAYGRSGWSAEVSYGADVLGRALTVANLDSFAANGYVEAYYTHFGVTGGVASSADPMFPTIADRDAVRLLRQYQDNGKILVARSSRLCQFECAREFVTWTETAFLGGVTVDIASIDDPQLGEYVPTLDEIRGLTWYVADATKVRFTLNGSEIAERYVIRSTTDGVGQSAGIRWHDYDRTDYTARTTADPTKVGALQSGIAAAEGFAFGLLANVTGASIALTNPALGGSATIYRRRVVV
jgi:hypothetical protein